MPSLTLKGIPEEVMERLRSLAEDERRSLNQQAILLLERALNALRRGRRRDELALYMVDVIQRSLPILSYDGPAAAWHAGERARLETLGRPAPRDR